MRFNLCDVAKKTPKQRPQFCKIESLQAPFFQFVTFKPKKYESVDFDYIRQAMIGKQYVPS